MTGWLLLVDGPGAGQAVSWPHGGHVPYAPWADPGPAAALTGNEPLSAPRDAEIVTYRPAELSLFGHRAWVGTCAGDGPSPGDLWRHVVTDAARATAGDQAAAPRLLDPLIRAADDEPLRDAMSALAAIAQACGALPDVRRARSIRQAGQIIAAHVAALRKEASP